MGEQEKTMEIAIGTKVIGFRAMTEKTFRELKGQGWGGHEDVDGYHVRYFGVNGKPDYDSWSPKDVFEDAYRDIKKGITIGDAVYFLERGKKVARLGWNGKAMWLMLVPEELAEAVSFQYEALKAAPWIGMKTADGKFVPWLASHSDMLAKDYYIVE